MAKRTRLQAQRTTVRPAPVTHIRLDPLALAEVKRIITPDQKYIVLNENEALIVPKRYGPY
jgi:hypothetical protein